MRILGTSQSCNWPRERTRSLRVRGWHNRPMAREVASITLSMIISRIRIRTEADVDSRILLPLRQPNTRTCRNPFGQQQVHVAAASLDGVLNSLPGSFLALFD